jgi:hypothetical protein
MLRGQSKKTIGIYGGGSSILKGSFGENIMEEFPN